MASKNRLWLFAAMAALIILLGKGFQTPLKSKQLFGEETKSAEEGVFQTLPIKEAAQVFKAIKSSIEVDEKTETRVIWLLDLCPQIHDFLHELEDEAAQWLARANVDRKGSLEMGIATFSSQNPFDVILVPSNDGKKFSESLESLGWLDNDLYQMTSEAIGQAAKKFGAKRKNVYIVLVAPRYGSCEINLEKNAELLYKSEAKLIAVTPSSRFQDSFDAQYQGWANIFTPGIQLWGGETAFRGLHRGIFTAPAAEQIPSGYGYWGLARMVKISKGAYFLTEFNGDPLASIGRVLGDDLKSIQYDAKKLAALTPTYESRDAIKKSEAKNGLDIAVENACKTASALFSTDELRFEDNSRWAYSPYRTLEENGILQILNTGASNQSKTKALSKFLASADEALKKLDKALAGDKSKEELNRSKGYALLTKLQLEVARINLFEMAQWMDEPKLKKGANQSYYFEPVSLRAWMKEGNSFEPMHKSNQDALADLRKEIEDFQNVWEHTPFALAAGQYCFVKPVLAPGVYRSAEPKPQDFISIIVDNYNPQIPEKVQPEDAKGKLKLIADQIVPEIKIKEKPDNTKVCSLCGRSHEELKNVAYGPKDLEGHVSFVHGQIITRDEYLKRVKAFWDTINAITNSTAGGVSPNQKPDVKKPGIQKPPKAINRADNVNAHLMFLHAGDSNENCECCFSSEADRPDFNCNGKVPHQNPINDPRPKMPIPTGKVPDVIPAQTHDQPKAIGSNWSVNLSSVDPDWGGAPLPLRWLPKPAKLFEHLGISSGQK